MSATRRAFTAVELLAATALAAVLLAGLVSVTAAIGRSRAAVERLDAAEQWHEGVAELLRSDLAATTELRIEEGRITLTGPLELDRGTLLATHRLATVSYEVVRLGQRARWLVRTQSAAGGQTWVEPLCPDVAGLELEAVDEQTARGQIARGARGDGSAASPSGAAGLVPAAVRLTLTPGDGRLAPLERVLVLR